VGSLETLLLASGKEFPEVAEMRHLRALVHNIPARKEKDVLNMVQMSGEETNLQNIAACSTGMLRHNMKQHGVC
jgi:hypothetical protein